MILLMAVKNRTGLATFSSASACVCVCVFICDLQCFPCSQRALCCAVSLTEKFSPTSWYNLAQTQTLCSSALWRSIGLRHKTFFINANRWISIIRSPLLRSGEGMQGPSKHMNDKNQVGLIWLNYHGCLIFIALPSFLLDMKKLHWDLIIW